MSARLIVVALLTAVYAVALGSAQPADLAAGAVIASALVLLLGLSAGSPPGSGPALGRRLLGFIPWAVVVTREVLLGTAAVARVALRPSRAPRAGIVAVPIASRSRTGVAVMGLAATLSPGELLIDVDWEAGAIYMHLLDASDPDAVRERHRRIYERYQRRVFP